MMSYKFNRLLLHRAKSFLYSLSTPLLNKAHSRRTVLVSGVQRSGTTALLEILDKSFYTNVFHEGNKLIYQNFMMKDLNTVNEVIAASPQAVVIVKALHEMSDIPSMLNVFPGARVIWIFRNFDDVVRSMTRKWPNGRNQLDEIVRDKSAGEWRSRGMTETTHQLLKDYYRQDMSDECANALFWWYRNRLLFDNNLVCDRRVIVVDYDELCREQNRGVDIICQHVGIAPNRRMVRHLRSPSRPARPAMIDDRVRSVCSDMLRELRAVSKNKTI